MDSLLMAEATFHKKIKGSVFFSQSPLGYLGNSTVRVNITLRGIPDGIHGIHVHENSIKFHIKKDPCSQAGGHFSGSMLPWKPNTSIGVPHGSWRYNTERHVGDLCNNIESINGMVNIEYYDPLISLIKGTPNCIVGKSIIIHEDYDDEGLLKFIDRRSLINSSEGELKNLQEEINKSLVTGNSGSLIACANIEYLN
jgi:Cu/Zn superoxide dismutase